MANDVLLKIFRDKTMTDRLMYIPNDETQNYPFCSNVWTLNLINQLIKIQ